MARAGAGAGAGAGAVAVAGAEIRNKIAPEPKINIFGSTTLVDVDTVPLIEVRANIIKEEFLAG